MAILTNKYILPEFIDVIIITLQYFPELKDINIQFVQKKWFHFTLASLIDWKTLFGPRTKRKYTIVINTKIPVEFDHVLFGKLSKNLQIGMLGHELAHVVDYQQRNFLQIVKILILYTIPSLKQKFERSIDIIAIKHGMGKYLHGFYTHITSKHTHITKKFMESYLDDDQIKELTYQLTGEKI
ncbi:MAG: hypothetical protein NT085_02435 [candidate division SR1 bacterium]|nr:hypothetical protein [candidate division SR1 bacterium]